MKCDDMRRDFTRTGLAESDLADDPIEQFDRWFRDACDARPGDWFEPNAMTLATASPAGQPSARIMLLKSYDAQGFTFFTNYHSDKGRQLTDNPRAAIVFYWSMLERQVRITGGVEQLDPAASRAYFHSRPRPSQLGALASQQSVVLKNRPTLEEKFQQLESQYKGHEIPMPQCWGGYLLTPNTIEFWQGRASRLHDRLRYRQTDNNSWIIERLSP